MDPLARWIDGKKEVRPKYFSSLLSIHNFQTPLIYSTPQLASVSTARFYLGNFQVFLLLEAKPLEIITLLFKSLIYFDTRCMWKKLRNVMYLSELLCFPLDN